MGLNPPASTARSQREIFAAALRCSDSDERDRLLDAECGEDRELREAVEDLLKESSEIGDFLERPVLIDTCITLFDPAACVDVGLGEAPGDQIGPYTLIEHIGEGGGGSVYLAEQTSPVWRRVALKILKLGMDTKSVIERFEAERQTVAMMEHPNIARVIDAGATEEGRPYFVMEYVPGEPLTVFCDANRLSVEERISVFVKICRAVEHAHQKGIIHRDLKPSNILVVEQDGEIVPKIIDFGVSKAVDPLTGETSMLTVIETVIGTPAYMSPEQAERGNRDVDTRSDVFSLGIILYELLTSYTPLGAMGVTKVGIQEALKAVRELNPLRPSAVVFEAPRERQAQLGAERSTTLERLGASFRGDLDWIVLKCLERERSRRFGSASDLARDLERYLEGSPVTARPPSITYRLGKLVRRHRVVVVACSLLLITLITASVVSVAFGIRATDAEDKMRQARDAQAALRKDAELDREKALQSADEARLHQYVAHINLAHQALVDGHIAKALHLLERYSSPALGETDLRGFEWWYLMGKCFGDEHRSLPSQDAPVEALAYSPNGELLVASTRDRTLVWSLAEDREVRSFVVGGWAVAFFSGGDRIAVAGREGIVVHDIDSGELVWELRDRDLSMAVGLGGRLMAAADRRGVTLWDTTNLEQVRHFPGASRPLSFSQDGKTLATGGRAGFSLWAVEGEDSQVALKGSPRSGSRPRPGDPAPVFSPDGRVVLLAQNWGSTEAGYSLGVWDSRSGHQISSVPVHTAGKAHTGVISAADFGQREGLLATGSWDHSVRLWDFESGKLARTLFGHRGEVWSVAVAPAGDFVASGSKDGAIKIWPTAQAARMDSIEGNWEPIGFSTAGALLAVSESGGLAEIDLTSGKVGRTLSLSKKSTGFSRRRAAIAVNSGLTVIAEDSGDGKVRIRHLKRGTEVFLSVSDRRVSSLSLSPGGDTMVAEGREELSWWDLSRMEEPIVRRSASRALFSADGSTLVMLARDSEISVWDTMTRKMHQIFRADESTLGSRVALSPDGRLLALTRGIDDYENTIGLWDTSTGERLGTFAGHKQGIWSLAFSADGKTLASSGSGGVIRLWSVAARSELLTTDRLGTALGDLLFGPNGKVLVGGSPSFSADRQLRIFRAETKGLSGSLK